MNEPDIWRWDAATQARAIRLGVISSREAVRAALDRCAAVNPKLNAVVEMLEDAALAAADAADRAVRSGEALGVLHGVPVTTKINVDQAGCATSNGVVAFRDVIATEDSPVVANLRKAGAVIFGRTNTPAFSMRWFTDNALHGRTLNPWSSGHTPGGSSGGASAAVAAGIGAVAQGNDMGGSVRYPAYATGVVGIRPSHGRIPAFSTTAQAERPLSGQMMSTQGPLARRVSDVRLALAAMAQRDIRDPWWMPVPLEGPPPARPIRVALSVDALGHGVHPEVRAAVLRAGESLTRAGYVVEEADPPDWPQIAEDWDTICHTDALLFMREGFERHGDEGAQATFRFMTARTHDLGKQAHLQVLARRATHQRAWGRFMETYPLILCPNSAEPPFPQAVDMESQQGFDRVYRAQGFQLANPLLGLPGVSVPTGLTEDGLPMGVQIIGQRWREDLALDAAEAIEAGCPMPTPVDPRF